MAKTNVRNWKISQRGNEVGFLCPGVGTFWAQIRSGRSARIQRFLSNLFVVGSGHPRYEMLVRGWTVSLEEKFGDQEERYSGIKYLTFTQNPRVPGVCLEFFRKIPPKELFDDIRRELGEGPEVVQEPAKKSRPKVGAGKPKPSPRKRKPTTTKKRVRKAAPKKSATATKVVAKSE